MDRLDELVLTTILDAGGRRSRTLSLILLHFRQRLIPFIVF
jgi:hypothetical protein